MNHQWKYTSCSGPIMLFGKMLGIKAQQTWIDIINYTVCDLISQPSIWKAMQ